MASSRADEFKGRLARWEEEWCADPKKTEITEEDIIKLRALIKKVQAAEKVLADVEEEVDEFLHS